MNNEKWVLALGDAFGGLKLIGPFETVEEAISWIGDSDVAWCVTRLENPDEYR